MKNTPKYSLIIPIYNEEENLPELYRRVSGVMERMDGPVELILINDGSRDRSLELLRELHEQDSRICYLSLARNFGHQIAVTAGLNFSSGQVVVIMDGDLQDPPELILDMVEQWRLGYQVVYAQRTQRRQEGWFKRLPAYMYYRILRNLADVDIPIDTGDFCLMDRCVVDVLNAMPERNRYIRGLRAWIGFKQTAVKFERDARFAGEVKYTFSFGDEWFSVFFKSSSATVDLFGFVFGFGGCFNGFFGFVLASFLSGCGINWFDNYHYGGFLFGCGAVGEYWDFGAVYWADL
jgi:glycosyltransferase involved in cell wall biosynthesis